MSQLNKYYEHSGKIGSMGLVYMVVFGVLSALILGFIYGYAIYYIPFIYLNFIITLGFGGIVGIAVGLGGKLGKVRNAKVALIFGLLFGLFAEYTGWVSWVYALSEQEALVLAPSAVWSVVQIVAETGAWSIFGWTPKGAAIFIIWGIEAIMIIGTATIAAWSVLSSTPFCERCNKWVDGEETFSPLEPVGNPDELKSRLEQGDFAQLSALQKTDTENNTHTKVKIAHCPDCKQDFYLTVKSIVISVDSDNKEKKDENDIIENLILSSDNYAMLKGQW